MAVSSLAGKSGFPKRSGYSASKHAMAGFFDSLRIELVNSGVSVTIIYPGFVNSEIRERAYGADEKPLGRSPVREAEVMTLRGKLGQWAKLIAPDLVDRMARWAIEEGK